MVARFAPTQTSSHASKLFSIGPVPPQLSYHTATMRSFLLKTAFLPAGWSKDVLVGVDDAGYIAEIGSTDGGPSAAVVAELVDGIVVPGMANAHSHAFQRAMAGDTEYRLSEH